LVLLLLTLACGGSTPSTSGTSSATGTILKLPSLTGQTIVVSLLGGGSYAAALQKDVFTPFMSATGANVVVNTNCCDAFVTQVSAGQFAGDLTMGSDYGPMQAWSKQGLLHSDNRISQIAKARGIQSAWYQSDLVAVDFYAWVLAWNTKNASDHPN